LPLAEQGCRRRRRRSPVAAAAAASAAANNSFTTNSIVRTVLWPPLPPDAIMPPLFVRQCNQKLLTADI